MQTLLEALEPIPGIDVNSLMDVMHGSEVQDQVCAEFNSIESIVLNKTLSQGHTG